MSDIMPNEPEERPSPSAVPYALVVPVLVVMAHDVWVVHGYSFRYNALLASSDPLLLVGLAIMVVISYFIIRPAVDRPINRWIAVFTCAAGFTLMAYLLLPKLAE